MTTLSIINEERKRREFLYHLYRRVTGPNYFGWSDGTFATSVYKDMEQNWGHSRIMPTLRYHLSEGNIYCEGYSDEDCQRILKNWDSLVTYQCFRSLHITHKGMMAVETDQELLKCAVNDGAKIDWSLADNDRIADGEHQKRILPEQSTTTNEQQERIEEVSNGDVQNERITRIRDQAAEFQRKGEKVLAQRYEKLADELEARYAPPPPSVDPPIQWIISERRYNEITEELVILGRIADEEQERDLAYLHLKIEDLEGRVEKLLADSSLADISGLEWIPKKPHAVKRATTVYKIVQEMRDEYESDLKDLPTMQELVDRVKNETQKGISERHLRRIIAWNEAGCPPK